MKNKKGFTLIELLAVLVVLAILALISIPITIRIINNARENSYKRSIASYGNALENTIGEYLLSNDIDYSKLKLSEDSKFIKYGNSNLAIQYTGKEVNCHKLKFKSNGDIILQGCQVENSDIYKYDNRQVIKQKYDYKIGNVITVNGMRFYVIEDSDKSQSYVVAIKEEPLTVSEVNLYGGSGTENNHVNRYTQYSIGTALNVHGYGGMSNYTSETCGIVNGDWMWTGCDDVTTYDQSDVKYAVDAWALDKFSDGELVKVDNYNARLVKYDELVGNLGCSSNDCGNSSYSWLYSSNYEYWTMSNSGTSYRVPWNVGKTGAIQNFYGDYGVGLAVRPVINVKKSTIESSD